jgi:PilZ domain
VTDSLQSTDPGTQKRRSTRIVQAVPITVTGTDALGQPFKERTTTVMVNCHGCKYQSKHYVPKNSMVTLDIPRPEGGPFHTQGRVVWVQRPRTVRELFQIGLEFEVPGNFWGIAFPPEDWASGVDIPTGDLTGILDATAPTAEPVAGISPQPLPPMGPPPIPPPTTPEKRIEAPPFQIPTPPPAKPVPVNTQTPTAPPVMAAKPASPPAQTPAAPAAPSVPAAGPSADSKIHVVPTPLPAAVVTADTQAALAKQMARMVADAKETLDKTLRRGAEEAITEEMTVVRQQLDVQLHETVEKAIKVSMDRVSESAVKKVVQQAADRTKEIVDEARRASETSASQLDEKVRNAVQQAVSHAAEQAAQQAAQQAAALTLKQSVEEVVERALREREASTPSLEILSSPEAAQNHLEQWRKNLEETAHAVRSSTIEQTQAGALLASQQWNAEFEAALTGASQKLGDKLTEVSREALAQAEQEAVSRAAGLRASLDETARAVLARTHQAEQDAAAHADTLRVSLDDAARAVLARTHQAEQDAAARADTLRASLDETARAVLARTHQAEQDAAARADALRASLDDAARAVLAQTEREASAQAQTLRSSLDEAINTAATAIESLGAGLTQERHRAEETRAQLQEAAQNALRQTRQQFDELLAAQQQEMSRKADQVIADRVRQIEPALQESAQEILDRAANELEQKLTPRLEQVHRAVSELQQAEQQAAHTQSQFHEQARQAAERVGELQHSVHAQVLEAAERVAQLQNSIVEQVQQATDHADRLHDTVREQTIQASELAIQESVARLRSEAEKVPAEVEKSVRETAAKIEEEIQQRSTETQHATYESLLKASEWYQKKAHSTMQSSMEKMVEQSSTALRDRAAEVSSLLASELDHYRRTYVEHSTAQIDESAKEIVSRERDRMSETAQMATAGFTDQVHRVTSESLRRFEQVSREALEKARADMEFGREGSLLEYQKTVDERMMQGVEQATVHLQSQLGPLIEQWESRREIEKKEWMEQLKKSNEEAIELYKTRLENASNSWLLASATTLGQHSQTVLDTIAKAAEKRLRETCSEVLGSMGDTLKARLLGLSTDFGPEADDEFPPKKK